MRIFQKRARLRRDGYTLAGDEFAAGKKGALIGVLNRACGGNDERKIVLGWIFAYDDKPPLEPKSSHSLSVSQWLALNLWIDADADNNWEPSEDFIVEIELIRKAAIAAFGADVKDWDIVDMDDQLTRAAIALGGKLAKEENTE